MEVDYAENEGSSSEDEDTESSSVSEDGDSSGVQPTGAGTLSPRAGRTPGRSPHAGQLRPAGSAGRGREERGGDWLPALGSTRTRRGALPGSRRVPAGGAGPGAGLGSPSSGTPRGPARRRTRPGDLRAVPGAVDQSRECPNLFRRPRK